jgi:glycosyltransferase involved in cell wall biosynthesis
MNSQCSISVVIPTRRRAEVLPRALRSVLSQTHPALETIVVVDGPDDSTVQSVASLRCPSVRLIVLPQQRGHAAAKNVGVAHARGSWIAFLDDDDEWLPHKLARQISLGLASKSEHPIVSSKVILRTPGGDYIKPTRVPEPGERIDEYLFCHRSLVTTESLLQTSTLLARRQLLEIVPFRDSQLRWDDADWLLRSLTLATVRLEFVPEPLSIWYTDDPQRRTVTNAQRSKFLSDWVRSNRSLFTKHAYSGALASISRISALEGNKTIIPAHLFEALRRGKPDLIQLSLFLAYFSVPARIQLGLRAFLRRMGA